MTPHHPTSSIFHCYPPSPSTTPSPLKILIIHQVQAVSDSAILKRVLKKAIGTGFYRFLPRAFTVSVKLGFILYVWPDRLPSQTTSCQPISLLSAIMKLFERLIEKCLRKHREDNGFFSKYQSGFRKPKSTNDHLFCLSQTIMESFN